jgi:simple sugar transport system permease protein
MTPLIANIASIVRNAMPLVIAGLGETITERVGVTNLSLDGSIVLSAMVGFAAASVTESLIAGFLAAMVTGAAIALLIAVSAFELKQDQVAIGFVLTLLCVDLAAFLGKPFSREPGPSVPHMPIPILSDIPIIGPIFFDHDLLVYVSYALIFGVWFFLYRTRWGLALRAVGERPESAYARGTNVSLQRYAFTIVGGALVGLAGATYSLDIRLGWNLPPAMRGEGWIALAIVIFGGWHPFRVAFGAYLFTALKALASAMQQSGVLSPVLVNMVPWIVMLLTLLMVSSNFVERLLFYVPKRFRPLLRSVLRSDPPKALGSTFKNR